MHPPPSARPLIVILTAVTAGCWLAVAATSPTVASVPVLALQPASMWSPVENRADDLLFRLIPLFAYLVIPIIAWRRNSVMAAWWIPMAPILGTGLFLIRLAFFASAIG